MDYDSEALKRILTGMVPDGAVHFFTEVGSTNDEAFQLALAGCPEGTVAIADAQSKGKGRLLRSWQSPPGRNIYLSLVLRPAAPPVLAPQLTLTSGVAMAEVLLRHCRDVAIKWPNDITIGGRKVCGILTEMRTKGTGVDFVIVGIGLNVNMQKEEFDEAHRDLATSLRIEKGTELPRIELIRDMYNRLILWYRRWCREGFGPIRSRWLELASVSGKAIRVRFKDQLYEGLALGIDEYGALLIREESGAVRRILAGDASLQKD
ncbi:MAG: biotin--[acetyl-CoA-carboxylase] ligase [Smithellaceae bacterium]|nr:biotin--[acetyl-CoA-carboxylase] ligase [Smithellaceae bacterium]